MLRQFVLSTAAATFCASLAAPAAQAGKLTTLAAFAAPQIGHPVALVENDDGHWYGIEEGTINFTSPITPTLFQLVKNPDGGTRDQIETLPVTATVDFNLANLVTGPHNQLLVGGQLNNCVSTALGEEPCAAVMALTPPTTKSGNWTESVIWQSGNAFDTVLSLHRGADGAVLASTVTEGFIQLVPPASGQANWAVNVIAGSGYYADPVTDPATGVIYAIDGSSNIVSLTPPATGQTGWTQAVLYTPPASSTTATMFIPQFMANGRIYGLVSSSTTASHDVTPVCCGSVAVLAPGDGNAAWALSTLFTFAGSNGAYPNSLVAGAHGVIYGATADGGTGNCSTATTSGCGTLFALIPGHDGLYAEKTLWNFSGNADGFLPLLAVDSHQGPVMGLTYNGGTGSEGTIFKLGIPAK